MVLCVSVSLLAILSLITVFGTDEWWVRLFDFPRLQLLVILLATGCVTIFVGPRTWWGYLTLAFWTLAVLYNGYKLIPYSALWPQQVADSGACPPALHIRILISNVQTSNRTVEPLARLIADAEPDIFLAMETDEWWDRQLDTITGSFANHLKEVSGTRKHFGIHLYSKLEQVSGEIRYLESEAFPSIRATYRLTGGQKFEVVALHPKPPSMFHDSTVRDVQLISGAKLAAKSPEPSILAGDLNATPWETTFRQMLRVGELSDPRVGRGLYNSYKAPLLGEAWPIDHVLAQQGFNLASFELGPDIGSDHLPIIAQFCRQQPQAGTKVNARSARPTM